MQKSMRLSDFHYPYAILISKFLHYFEVDIKGELAEIIKPSNEINSGSLSKMRFTKIGGRWVSKDGDQVGRSGTNDGDEPEDATTQEEPAAETQEVGHNDAYMGERMTTMSPFERLIAWTHLLRIKGISMICESKFNHMDSRFSSLDEQIEQVQNQIMELQFERENNHSF